MDFGQRNKISPQGNMSSMTDLVFLLLIFFIILSTNVVNGEQVELPETTSGPVDMPPVTITITSANVIQLNGKAATMEELPAKLNAYFFDKAEDRKKVIINGDRASDFGIAIEVMSLADDLGLDVSVATRDKK